MSSAPEYKDLDELRLEYLLTATNTPVSEIARLLYRTPGAIRRKMDMMGLSIAADRLKCEVPWHAR